MTEASVDAADEELEGETVGKEESEEGTDQEEEDGGEENGEKKPKRVRSPGNPTAAEREEHELTHWPYRSWCDACVKARATGQPHRAMKGEYAESTVARVLMDYGFLHEEETVRESEHGTETEAKVSMTVMVMMETLCSSVWAYALEGKGASSLDWLAQQVVADIESVGLANERIITKTDQEPAIVQLQQEVAKQRKEAGTALENSRVGDSDSNGKIERAIREVKGLIRTFRCDIEGKTGKTVKLSDPIVPWIVRHAAYVITRCRVGSDGKTALQRIKGRKVNVPWVPFGETVLFKLPKVPKMPGDFRDRFEEGVWVGCTVRTGEHLVATPDGVFKVSSIVRKAEDRRWSSERLEQLRGTPNEPVPGSGSSKMVAYAKHRADAEATKVEYTPRQVDEEPEVRVNYIYKKDVEKYGATEGCAGCRALLNPISRYRAKHTQECRDRMEREMLKTHEGLMRVVRANERQNLARERAEEKKPEQEGQETGEEEGSQKKRKAGEPEKKSSATGSGLTAEEREKQVKEKKKEEQEEEVEMGTETSAADQSHKETLESAPEPRSDIRVPLAHREPAVKRSRETTSPERSDKWQAVEVPDESIGTKRKPEGSGEQEDRSKFLAVPEEKGKATDSLSKHPGPKVSEEEIERRDMQWRDIGSGTMARTFKGASKLMLSTKGGPPPCDVHRRTVWDLETGRVIDDCVVEDTPDEVLFRELPKEMNIRVELVLKDAISMYQRQGADVVEVFSQPRIAQEAAMRSYGGTNLNPGWSLDLTRYDPKTGKAWDLSDKKVQSRVVKMVMEGKPLFLIGSPPCTAMSVMQNINKERRDPAVVRREIQAAEEHIRFCIVLYKLQIKNRRYFVHEHPEGASSWKMQEMVELAMMPGVNVVTFDMCCFGMVATQDGREGPVRKRTRLASNSKEVIKRVDKKCPNDSGIGEKHVHVVLEGSRTKNAQVYPRQFCRAICEGIAAEKRLRSLGLEVYSLEEVKGLSDYGHDPSGELHEDEKEWMNAMDDVSGEALDTGKVRTARKEEMVYFKKMGVYKKVPLKVCWEETGKAPIGVRWVDINKGDSLNPNYRSRLVAREFKTEERPEWYAATPPSECLKLMISKLASDKNKKMMYADVSRAYFYARAARAVYVKLPEEDLEEGDEEMCGMLNVSMYGTRDAALNWANEYGDTLKAAGFKQGVANPCLFWNPATDVAIMVHGDDFVGVGSPEDLKATREVLNDKYKIKVETLGGGTEDTKEIRVLNKVLRYTEKGVELEADPRHAELVIRQLGLEEAKPSITPGVKRARFASVRGGVAVKEKSTEENVEQEEKDEGEEEMNAEDAKVYRGLVARLNYIAPERMDIQFAVKEAARNMAKPKKRDWHALVRIGKYLKGRPRMVVNFEWQFAEGTVAAYTDSDWAGCVDTAKSTSGGIMMIGKHVVKTYSRQQRTIALSSAEAELHAMVAASAEALGIVKLCKDLGMKMEGEVYADSSAALGIAQRTGMGKVRHVRVQALWVQEVRCTKSLKYKKVLGSRNPADLLTKHVPRELLDAHSNTIGVTFAGGRADSAPTLDSVEAYTEEWEESIGEGEKGTDSSSRREGNGKRVTFKETVKVRGIPSVGLGRKVTKGSRSQFGRKKGVG